ncbi:MAG: hypothetical protein AAFX87_23015 [Bacteroidota bacterium]
MNKKSGLQVFIEDFVLSTLSLLKVLILSKLKVKLQAGENVKKRVAILANGPSLKTSLQEHELFLKDQDLICVNHFPTTAYYEQYKPQYYITSAPDLWLEDIEARFIEQSKVLFETMAAKTTWDIQFFIPHEARKHKLWQSRLKKNPHIKIHYFNNTPIEGFRWFRHLMFKSNLGMPRPHNVLIPCLMISLALRYKEISLLGADHSWLPEISVTDENDVLINQKHFYDEHTSKAMPLDKRGKGKRRLHELLNKFMNAFKGYFIIKEYAESLNASILNATKNSYIDAFDRITLEKADQKR